VDAGSGSATFATPCGDVERVVNMNYAGGDISCGEKAGGCVAGDDVWRNNMATRRFPGSREEQYQACASYCCSLPLCHLFTLWEGVCWPKKAHGYSSQGDARGWSGRLDRHPLDTCTSNLTRVFETAYHGADIRCREDLGLASCPPGSNVHGNGLLTYRVTGSLEMRFNQCGGYCCKYKECKTFTVWSEHCWLKHERGYNVGFNQQYITGRKAPLPSSGCGAVTTLQQNVVFMWGDLNCNSIEGGCGPDVVPRGDKLVVYSVGGSVEQRHEQCAAYCCRHKECAAFTFQVDGNCYLKRAAGWQRWTGWNGYHSAVLVRPSVSPTPSATPTGEEDAAAAAWLSGEQLAGKGGGG
jgi:hypothetical protein